MSRTYAEMRDLAEQIYQDTGNAVAGTVEWDYWIEEGLKKFSTYRPHLVDVIFKLESRSFWYALALLLPRKLL